MSNLFVYLKGGAVVEADVTEFSLSRSSASGEFVEASWKSKDSGRKLMNLKLDQIAAVVFDKGEESE